MKQIVQNLGNGDTDILDVPAPELRARHALVGNRASLVSLGTERMLIKFGQANWFDKARQQPEKVKMVLEKAATDGVASTVDAVRSKLNQPIPMGYCAAGVVLESDDANVRPGDRVVTNGAHAEVVCVPRNLVARIPDNVSFEQAAFTPAAAIGLQGVRLAVPQIGETVVVMGLGLIGLLVVQLLVAQGCTVIGLDFDDRKLALATGFGASTIKLDGKSSPVSAVIGRNHSHGVDAVLITASTDSSDPVSHAAQMCRQRGKIVLVGVAGLHLNRAEFYEKELTFQVSCSYGPGRYDEQYEQSGNDYPRGFVRWTEQRNFEAVLQMLSTGQVKVEPLITHRRQFDDAVELYQNLANDPSALGIVLEYAAKADKETLLRKTVPAPRAGQAGNAANAVAGVIGAGNYASRVLIPAMKKSGIALHTLVSVGGLSAAHHAAQQRFGIASSDIDSVLQNPAINLVVIATRHDSHADLVCEALAAGKHVFVEKPLALSHEELDRIESTLDALGASSPRMMVGFNRRFAPLVVKMKSMLDTLEEPKCFNFLMNAGSVPADSWVQSVSVGGGRIVGEACHLVDLMRFLAGAAVTSIHARSIGKPDADGIREDKAVLVVGFADGSLGTIHYFANGSKKFPKERFEVFAAGRVLQLDNFRKLTGFGWPGFTRQRMLKQDKGQVGCVSAFARSVADGLPSPIPADEIMEVSRVAIDAALQIRAQESLPT